MISKPGKTFVFLDPCGKRWLRMRIVLVIGLLVVGSTAAWFLDALLVQPQLAISERVKKSYGQLRELQTPSAPALGKEQNWMRFKTEPPKNRVPAGKQWGPVRLGWCENGDQRGYRSLKAHGSQLTHVCSEWISLQQSDGALVFHPDQELVEICREKRLALLPVLNNSSGTEPQPEPVENLANGRPAEREKFYACLLEELERVGAPGVLLDWEDLDPSYRSSITDLIIGAARVLHQHGKELWMVVPIGDDTASFDMDRLAGEVDRFVALLLDENSADEEPGPLASLDWIKGWVQVLSAYGQPEQWVGVLGGYGVDWAVGQHKGELISVADALSRARCAGLRGLQVAGPSYNGQFSYEDESGAHKVSFLDAVSFLNQAAVLQAARFGGIGLVSLGMEETGIWEVLGADRFQLKRLGQLHFSDTIASVGQGEVVEVNDEQAQGHRKLEQDLQGHVSATYTELPACPTLFHQGSTLAHSYVLSFDDGPDPEWTPLILDILKERNIKAVFFVTGAQASANPALVQRIVEEGHEIGNHTYSHPNLGEISDAQIKLELNATQVLIKDITGYSTTLFRPPFNADSHPSDVRELRPLKMVQDELGYLIVLEKIDPEDWGCPGAGVILQRIKDQSGEGKIILLHDAGGDRSQTVAALPKIIDYFEERGDRLVSLSELLAVPRQELMPEVNREQTPVNVKVGKAGFRVLRLLEWSTSAAIGLATLLVLARAVLVVFLALRRRLAENSACDGVAAPVSVLIAAYNEAKVIKPTLEALLQSDYPGPFEIVVVDDGSSDRTAEEVESLKDPRIRLVRQSNMGKAVALNTALAQSSHELLVFLDSDTQFAPSALRELVKPFGDPAVAGVAGHGKVGNPRTLIAKCQALEYACGFNLDRRAYAAWNCITVLPGAICAVRREALVKLGGFSTDTLAEDTDLTLALHRLGHRIEYAPKAIAWTEAPESFLTLAKQRFRWAFGTLQCLWKHRDLLFSSQNKALGWFSLPSIWLFQICLVAVTPLIDLWLVFSILTGNIPAVWVYALVFLVTDIFLAALACWMEGDRLRKAWLITVMRLIYRPLLSFVVWRSLIKALKGVWVHWGKLERAASVQRVGAPS